MTDVNKSKTQKITSFADALPLYAPPPAGFANKIGVEVEMPLMKLTAGKPQIPTTEDMAGLQAKLKGKGFDAQLEPSGVIEYASPPFNLGDTRNLLNAVKQGVEIFTNDAADAGFARSPFCIVPTTTKQEALGNMAARERLQASLAAMQDIFDENTLRLPMLTSSIQTSFSPANADDMFSMAYRAYAMSPLLMAATNSSSGFIVNEEQRLDYLPRAKYYLGYGDAGGISPAFLKSENGQEFIQNHIEAVFKAPMHFAYDLDGGIIKSTKDNVITFEKLVAQGLNTQSNYELAETFLYNDVKVCNLRDETGAVVGKRLEVRGADSGIDQPAMAVLMTAALVPNGPAAREFERVLQDYGFTGNPKADADLFLASRDAVVNNGGKFMDVKFGTGSLRDFAADVANILVNAYEGQKMGPDMARLMDVLLTGNCDGKIFKAAYPTLDDVKEVLKKPGSSPANNNAAPKAKQGLTA